MSGYNNSNDIGDSQKNKLQDISLKQIERILDSLGSTTNWIIGSLVVIAFSSSSIENGKIEMFGFKVPEKEAGLAMFTFVFGLNFYILKLSRSLKFLYLQLGDNNIGQIKETMQKHFWICNPFSKTGTTPTLIDSIGYPIFILLWWLGFSLGFKLSTPFNSSTLSLITAATGIFFFSVVGIATGLTYGKLPWKKKSSFSNQVTNNGLRDFLAWSAILVGWTIFFVINGGEVKRLSNFL
jgi:hypothetical protein